MLVRASMEIAVLQYKSGSQELDRPSVCHFLRFSGDCGSVISSETEVGPPAATSAKEGDFPYLSLTCSRNTDQRCRYTLFQGIGSLSTVPLPGPYGIAN